MTCTHHLLCEDCYSPETVERYRLILKCAEYLTRQISQPRYEATSEREMITSVLESVLIGKSGIFARFYAAEKHADQMYGSGEPYTVHLQSVVNVAKSHGFDRQDFLCACWLHDVIEDTRGTEREVTREDLTDLFGEFVAGLVWSVSNEPGHNRKARHEATYPKIRNTPMATALKLCDRIANVETSVKHSPDKLAMYRKEHAEFRAALWTPDSETEELWDQLEAALR